ncbi:MAG: galactose-phosphate uridylyltransferase [Actinomycetota bacterium]
MTHEIRTDPHLGTVVHLVAGRQSRPNLPVDSCPFCVGGLEAPDPYEVRAFKNRWPALEGGAAEVVLYSPDHEATLASLGADHIARIVDLWADRTAALRELPGGEHVVVFENFGAEIGATIAHPHGQIYAFDHVPDRSARMLRARWVPDTDPGERLIADIDGWRVWCESAPVHPVSVRLAPVERVPDLCAADTATRHGLAASLSVLMRALASLHGEPCPYMMWINQSPRDTAAWPDAWLNLEVVSPWRAPRLPRYIAAVEVATGEYFNPVDPADVASRLRALV